MSDQPDIFLSYNREDLARAKQFAEGFERAGFSVWWDVTLRSGENYDEVTEAALRSARAVVVLWSKRSVVSRWVRAEATLADRNRTLMPAMIEPCDRPIMFELTQTAELSHWHGDESDSAWCAFIDDLRRFLGKEIPAEAHVRQDEPEAEERPVVLVLPFVNRSGEAEQEYFSDGVSEDIITDLGRICSVDVISRNTAFAYKGRIATSAELASTLGVSHILEGSVRKVGERVRITAQLLDAQDDVAVWTDRFDRQLDDIFALQDEISESVVKALKLTLLPRDQRALDRRDTTNGEAYELFLLARQFERTGSERMKPLIVRLCEKAVELDPGFARAWALMGDTRAELVQRSIPGFTIADAKANAERAVELAPQLPESHAALADVILRCELDLDAAAKPTEVALGLDPDCYEANVTAGYIAIGQKRYEDAVRYLEKAIEIEPDAYRPAGMVDQAYEALGNHQDVLRSARRCLATCERILAYEPDHGGAMGFQVNALITLGEGERAKVLAKRAQILDPDNSRLLYNLACGMAPVDPDLACDLLERIAPKVSRSWVHWMDIDNSLDPIRDSKRFKAMRKAVIARLDAEGV